MSTSLNIHCTEQTDLSYMFFHIREYSNIVTSKSRNNVQVIKYICTTTNFCMDVQWVVEPWLSVIISDIATINIKGVIIVLFMTLSNVNQIYQKILFLKIVGRYKNAYPY